MPGLDLWNGSYMSLTNAMRIKENGKHSMEEKKKTADHKQEIQNKFKKTLVYISIFLN